MIELAALIIVAGLFAGHLSLSWRREQAWTVERSVLLNRIKPETAQVTGGLTEPDRPAVDLNDDADWHDAREELTHGRTG